MSKLLEGTRIYRDVTQMLTQTLDFTKDFPKAYRYSVGEQMQNIAMRMVNEVASGYITRNVETVAYSTEVKQLIKIQSNDNKNQ